MASNLRSWSRPSAGSASPVFKYRSPPQSRLVSSNWRFSCLATALRTLTPSAATSGPVPSPPMTAILWVLDIDETSFELLCGYDERGNANQHQPSLIGSAKRNVNWRSLGMQRFYQAE